MYLSVLMNIPIVQVIDPFDTWFLSSHLYPPLGYIF